MSGMSALLADRVASLLPNTTAGACVPASPWTSYRSVCGNTSCCVEHRTCHLSCHGKAVCGGWAVSYCYG
jgi:hypothetical protein